MLLGDGSVREWPHNCFKFISPFLHSFLPSFIQWLLAAFSQEQGGETVLLVFVCVVYCVMVLVDGYAHGAQ